MDSRDILEHMTPREVVERLLKRANTYELPFGDHVLMNNAASMILALERDVDSVKRMNTPNGGER